MYKAVLGLTVSAVVLSAAAVLLPGRGATYAQSPAPASGPQAELIALTALVGDKYQQVTVIDPHQRVMSVYHVELATGYVELRSVRNIQWDLQMTDFNGKSPLPQEILSMLAPK